MSTSILLSKLKHGDKVPVYNSEGQLESYDLRPPNKYMLAAAKVIEELSQQLANNQHYMNQLQHERDEAIDELDRLKSANVQSSNDSGQA